MRPDTGGEDNSGIHAISKVISLETIALKEKKSSHQEKNIPAPGLMH
jgi:hypothetical protein